MPSIRSLKAFNFQAWIDENKDKFKPPVGNAQVWEDGEMMVTVVGGPNQRRDYHDDPTEEFFYQLKGNISVRIMEKPGQPPVEIPIKEGEVFLLPKHTRHSPQRVAGSIGVVVFRVVLSELPSAGASRGSEAEEHRAGFAAVVRTVLWQRESAQVQALRHGASGQTVDGHRHSQSFFPCDVAGPG